jgi:hypothetical protein
MKTAFAITLPIFALAAIFFTSLPAHVSAQSSGMQSVMDTVIDPGASVGPLKLGDSRAHALELFPQKPEDQAWDDPCGQTLDWTDTSNPMGRGELLIRINKDRVFQIESATTRFKTAEGITTFSAPEDVRNVYKNLRAFVLLTPPVPALGDRPLVFWIDKKRGLAFAFAYDPSHRKRYVYKIIVFEPNKEFCPELEKTSSPKWQGLAPYSVEPPPELSPEH